MKALLFMTILFSFSSASFARTMRHEIHAQIHKYVEGWANSSGQEFASPYTKNASFVNIFTFKLNNREEIAIRHQKIFDGFFKGSRMSVHINPIRVVSADTAIAVVDWKLSGLKCKAPDFCPNQGTITHTFHQSSSGQWMIEASQNTLKTTPPKSLML